jgi:hypothetical protein
MLIKDILKQFSGIKVNSFDTTATRLEVQERITAGINDADYGRVNDWSDIKQRLVTKIESPIA